MILHVKFKELEIDLILIYEKNINLNYKYNIVSYYVFCPKLIF